MDRKVYEYRAPVMEQPRVGVSRWFQLIIGIVCMAMIANLQYGWTLFVNPIAGKYHFDKRALQYAFTIFVLFETWLVPSRAMPSISLGRDSSLWRAVCLWALPGC